VNARAFAELQRQFERWSFRMPGYRWELLPGLDVGFSPRVVIYVETTDAYHPDRTVTVMSCHLVPEILSLDPEGFGEFLRRCVHATVLHEADEWLRRDNVMMFDPHKRGPRG
jgi:hypothetical protein